MKRLEIIRLESGGECVRGVARLDGVLICCTLELPYKDNAENVSSILEGTYKGTRHKSPEFGNVFKVHDVPNRTDILIHVGNMPKDTQGCILVGQSFGELEGKLAVLDSKKALAVLKEKLGNETFEVAIKENF